MVSDYQWMLKVFLGGKHNLRYLDRDIAIVGTEGRSSASNWENERVEVMKRFFSRYEIARYRILPMKLRSIRQAVRRFTLRFSEL